MSSQSPSVQSYEVDDRALIIHTGTGLLVITPWSARTVRIRYRLGTELSRQASLAVVADMSSRTPVPFTVLDRVDELVLATDALTIEIDRLTAAFTYRAADGTLLTREPKHGGKHLDPIDVRVSVFDEATLTERRQNADGVRIDALNVRQVVDRQAFHTKIEFQWVDGEGIYGLGSHEEGMFNLRGQHQFLYQENRKVAVPVILSTRGYGIFLDCSSLVTFHDDPYGSYLWGDVDEELDYYFVVGPQFDDIIADLRDLTGQVPMLPRWAFGYLQSKERYQTQAELLEVAREYRARQLPLDCIVLDWKSWTGELWGQKSLDPARFPDPQAMVDELHRLDVRLMVSIWPIMRPGGDDWRELADGGHLLGNQATYDAFDPAARAAYWRQAERGLFRCGIDAWWSDCTEPFEADWSGAVKPEPEERLRINTEEAKRYLDPEFINAYSLVHSEGIYAGQRAVRNDKRVLNLTRSGFMGQQRYATVTWSGDVAATWETLRRQIADGLSFCVTGLPYWTTDIGAFFVARKPDLWFWAGDFDDGVLDLGYRELYLRWFQYAAWLPMFRAHGTDTPREIWRFGDPARWSTRGWCGRSVSGTGCCRISTRWPAGRRTAHTPCFVHCHSTSARTLGSMTWRTSSCSAQRSSSARSTGRAVSPPSHGRSSTAPRAARSICHPERPGSTTGPTDDWMAARRSTPTARFERIPVFVREGSIVPMGPVRQHSGDARDAALEIHVYPGRDATFMLYEDEGDGYGYESGAHAMIELGWDDSSRCLTVGERVGAYPSMPVEREFSVTVHDGPGESDTAGDAAAGRACRRVRYAGLRVAVGC